ncbi:E3 ubiquitin-protein ligase TTC3 [Austrofundulus limnaeus]|uniref:E3 ubiquitin-protein ligase TTC3 n=1 Tax=Austrofundulus limnaeus TaxID=52670 RepID=A0A2I4CNZ5_AUSLI|nr:PREDICTED: E3 ubiquitin-protein ligase TTC3-like [Austrofundulus limnaeus]
MSDSDSDGECRYLDGDGEEVFAVYNPEKVFARWSAIPVKTKRDAAQRMKVCVFWLPILLEPDNSVKGDWARSIGLVNPNDSEALELKHIMRIQVVESIMFDLDILTLKKDTLRHIFCLTNLMNEPFCPNIFEKVVRLLETSKNKDDRSVRRNLLIFDDLPTGYDALRIIFSEYARFIKDMGSNMERTLTALMSQPDEYSIMQSERMKKVGNELFQRQRFEEAVRYYSKAIDFFPDNHILYGNRSLCYIRNKQYLKAAADGKRAVLIKPQWAKGHYRYCEALFLLNQKQLALEANKMARSLCGENPEELRDLDQQLKKMTDELAEKTKPKQSFKAGSTSGQHPTKCAGSDQAKNTSAKVTEMKTGEYI